MEARVHRIAQRLIPQDWTRGYPPMVVWYHRELPMVMGDDGLPVEPRRVDPRLVDAAAKLGALVDFIVVPCNAAHAGLREMREAARCPVLSMIDVVADDVTRRTCARVGLLGARGVPQPYLDALRERAVADLRARSVDAVILGCTEIPLLLGDETDAPDLIHPAALLADAAVRLAIA